MKEMSDRYRRNLESERRAAVLIRHAMRLDTEAFVSVLLDAAGPQIKMPENAEIDRLLMGALHFGRRAIANVAGSYRDHGVDVSDEQIIDGMVTYLTNVLEGIEEPPPEAS